MTEFVTKQAVLEAVHLLHPDERATLEAVTDLPPATLPAAALRLARAYLAWDPDTDATELDEAADAFLAADGGE